MIGHISLWTFAKITDGSEMQVLSLESTKFSFFIFTLVIQYVETKMQLYFDQCILDAAWLDLWEEKKCT